jgi:hypothetical protein
MPTPWGPGTGALADSVTETLLPPGAVTAAAAPLVPHHVPAHTRVRDTPEPVNQVAIYCKICVKTKPQNTVPARIVCVVQLSYVPVRVVMLDLAGVLHPAGRVLLRHLRLLLGLLHAHTLLTRQGRAPGRRRTDAPPSRVTGSQQSLAPRRQHQHHRL